MKYAVIETGGKQYRITEGQTLNVEKLKQPSSKQKNQEVVFENVLLVVDEGKAKIGQPFLDVKVKAKILEDFKDKKVVIAKYKAKTGYSRRVGHRQPLTKVQIEKIES